MDTTSRTIHRPRAGRQQPGDRGDDRGEGMNWNDVITINGHEITVTPQPGMVVQPIGYNVWAMLGKPQCGGWAYIYNGEECYRDPVAILRCTTPVLLPPSDLYGAWDALLCLFHEDEHGISAGKQHWETGAICATRLHPEARPEIEYQTYVANSCMAKVPPVYYDAHMRDMQKYGVLLDWGKLWEAK